MLHNNDVAPQAVKSSVAIAGTTYAWLTLNEWVALATLIFIIVQAAILLHKHLHYIQDRRSSKDG